MLTQRDSVKVAQTWFQKLNPHLNDQSPAGLLREHTVDEVGASVLTAVRTFASVGEKPPAARDSNRMAERRQQPRLPGRLPTRPVRLCRFRAKTDPGVPGGFGTTGSRFNRS